MRQRPFRDWGRYASADAGHPLDYLKRRRYVTRPSSVYASDSVALAVPETLVHAPVSVAPAHGVTAVDMVGLACALAIVRKSGTVCLTRFRVSSADGGAREESHASSRKP